MLSVTQHILSSQSVHPIAWSEMCPAIYAGGGVVRARGQFALDLEEGLTLPNKDKAASD